jgi:uncharacterized SAM-binding protein YcdF (DUF218 family)
MLSFVALAGVPWAYRLAQVLRGARGDEPGTADAILVLGRKLEADQLTPVFEARLAHAEALWRQGLAPRIFVAGGATGSSMRSEAEAGRDWLLARGIPEGAVLMEGCSQDTLENLFNVRAEMRKAGWHTLLMVSDPLHLGRARATAQGLDLAVRCSPAHAAPPAQGSFGWWRRAASEAFLLHWYHTGMFYSRIIRSERQLERVT